MKERQFKVESSTGESYDEWIANCEGRQLNTTTSAYMYQICLIMEKKGDDWLEKFYRKLIKNKVKV